MNVYIEADYFDIISKVFEREKHFVESNKINNIKVIYQMFLALNVYTTIRNNDIIKYIKNESGNKNYSSIKDLIISRGIKNQTLRTIKEINEIDDYNGFYFTKKTLNNTFNVVSKDAEFSFDNFYDNCNQNGFQFNGNIKQIAKFTPPANAMIIVDPYIFETPFLEKKRLLIEFIMLHKKKTTAIPFQLTILTKSGNNNINSAFADLSTIENIEIEIINFNRLGRDRYILSNYSYTNIQHPFELRETHFNQNFLAHEYDARKIIMNYSQFQKNIKKIKNKIAPQPNQTGTIIRKWSNVDFTNRLFNLID